MPARTIVPVDRGGGGDTFLGSLLALPSAYPNLQIDVVALMPQGEPIEPPPNVTITYVRSERLHRWLWIHREAKNPVAAVALLLLTAFALVRAAWTLTRRHRYGLIYAVGGPIAGLAGIVVKRLARLPLAAHFQYTYRFSRQSPAMRFAAGAFYRQLDALIGNCPMLGKDAASVGMPPERCHSFFNWIDHDRFRPLPDRAEHRARYGIAPNQTAFYFGGRFDYTKHVDRVIDALRDLDEPRAVFFFAGDGVLGDELRSLSEKNPNVRVLGTIARDELPALHAACDVQFWGSVDVDYPGLVVMEAMSSGLPVHTSSKTMNPLYEGWDVEPGFLGVPRCARLYPPDRAGIRRAIGEAIENREALAASRPAVAAFAREHFGEANAAALVDLLRSLGAGAPATVEIVGPENVSAYR